MSKLVNELINNVLMCQWNKTQSFALRAQGESRAMHSRGVDFVQREVLYFVLEGKCFVSVYYGRQLRFAV